MLRGRHYRALSQKRGLSQVELARAAGVAQSLVSELERGHDGATSERLRAMGAAVGAGERMPELERRLIRKRRAIIINLRPDSSPSFAHAPGVPRRPRAGHAHARDERWHPLSLPGNDVSVTATEGLKGISPWRTTSALSSAPCVASEA